MPQMIFVNLPVRDLARSIAFYEAVGAKKNPMFCDETAACMVFSETVSVMLLTHEKYAMFTPKPVADAHTTSSVLLCISEESREAVDAITEAALAAGAIEPSPVDDHGFMYGRSFEDPDGHSWAPMYMDMEAAKIAMAPQAEAAAA
jgi:predicted lactoylglutathione lyase